MRSHLLTGATGLEGKTLLDHSDVSNGASGRQRICGATQGVTVRYESLVRGRNDRAKENDVFVRAAEMTRADLPSTLLSLSPRSSY